MNTIDMKYKIRYHLGKGENYMKWQVRGIDTDELYYFTPEDVVLDVDNAVLKNNKKTAQKINDGENKTVCSWIECESIMAYNTDTDVMNDELDKLTWKHHLSKETLSYNPKKLPNWVDSKNNDVDGEKYERLIIDGRIIKIIK
jgi:hypothetical protein